MKTVVSKWIRSPNRSLRSKKMQDNGPDLLVMHGTAGTKGAVFLGQVVFASTSRKASSHYGIDDNLVAQYVDEDEKAWHAGDGLFPRNPADPNSPWVDNVNDRSIGIELCNRLFAPGPKTTAPGKHRNPRARNDPKCQKWQRYAPSQMQLLDALIVELMARHPSLKYVTGHEDVTNNWTLGDGNPQTDDAVGAKLDPGPYFPWEIPVARGLTRVRFNFDNRKFELD